MNSPIYILDKKLPHEILYKIQLYLPVNNEVRNALIKYYNKIHNQKILDEEKTFKNDIYPNCRCSNCPDNGQHKLFIRRNCSVCFEYEIKEFCDDYISEKYKLVIKYNPQYKKIAYGIIDNYEDPTDSLLDHYNIDDGFLDDERNIWIEDYDLLEIQ